MLWIERFETLEELRAAVRAFGRLYNREWLLERHGYRTPVEARGDAPRRARRGGQVGSGAMIDLLSQVSGYPGAAHTCC